MSLARRDFIEVFFLPFLPLLLSSPTSYTLCFNSLQVTLVSKLKCITHHPSLSSQPSSSSSSQPPPHPKEQCAATNRRSPSPIPFQSPFLPPQTNRLPLQPLHKLRLLRHRNRNSPLRSPHLRRRRLRHRLQMQHSESNLRLLYESLPAG